jgi:hypothetical protein
MTMERRDFLKLAATTASIMAAHGYLPLLAAEKKKKASHGESSNWFTEPCATEPITGYLEQFTPVKSGGMTGDFSARYTLLHWQSAGPKSRNSERGFIDVNWQSALLKTTETRANRPSNIVKTSIKCEDELNTAQEWTLSSSLEGKKGLGFEENGTWDGKTMKVKAKSWSQESPAINPLIARWALLPLLASGKLKNAPLAFDMLDDSTLRPNQILRYEGEISVPVKGGTAKLFSYVQTGNAIVPTHYLVDEQGRVQLITMSMVNWALLDLNAK